MADLTVHAEALIATVARAFYVRLTNALARSDKNDFRELTNIIFGTLALKTGRRSRVLD